VVVRIFGWSIGVTIVSMIVAFLYGGWQALFLVTILGVLEVSLSFDNAVINATVLRRMSEFWQRIFLTIGIIIAVFGMRLLFPLIIVWAASGLGPVAAIDLALNPPADGAATFPDGSPSYETLLTDAHPQIAAFGGMFLLMLFLGFIFEHREITWLSWLERPLARIGRLNQLSVVVASIILVLTAEFLAEDDKISTVMVAGVLGMVTYIAVNGLGELFHVENDSEDAAGGPTALAKATGKAGFFLFLYLEVLDASFSFDGVIGAFALSNNMIIIALGLSVGAMFVRSMTIHLVRTGTLAQYRYLEHGAFWAIIVLGVIMLLSARYHIPETITGLLGAVLIGLSFLWSVRHNRRHPEDSMTQTAD